MNRILRSLSNPHLLAGVGCGLLTFVVYLRTLTPTVGFIDSGELSTVAVTLGIAHPTGYPLFTLLGSVFARLPIGSEEIVRLNLMAALLCAAGVTVFFCVFRDVLRRVSVAGETPWLITGAAAGGALVLAFSETYWMQAVAVEVYSLHVFLLGVVLLLFLRADAGDGRWEPAALLLGLCFTNHMTTVLLGPGLAYWYFSRHGFRKQSWVRLVKLGPWFALGLSPYLYLPIRAAAGPPLSWGNPVSLERLLWHVSGKQYRVWIFSSTEAAGRQFRYFLDTFPMEFAYVGLALAAVGLLVLALRNRRLFTVTVLLFVTCVAYAINYDIHDIDSYFLLAYIVTALWSAIGLAFIARQVAGTSARAIMIAAAVLPLAAIPPAVMHYRAADQSDNTLVDDYTHNVFASLERNAVVLSYQWDYWVSASLYYQHVRGERTDVTVIDKELLRRSWYLDQLERGHPWLVQASRAEVEAFRRELDKFEHDLPYDGSVIQRRFEVMINSFVRRSMETRPVYVTGEIEREFTVGLQRIPTGLVHRVREPGMVPIPSRPEFRLRGMGRHGRLEDAMWNMYVQAYLMRSAYCQQAGDREEGVWSARKASEMAEMAGIRGH